MKIYTQPTCPKCKVLKKMLDNKNLLYETSEDLEYLKTKDILFVPVLELDDGRMLDFTESVKWINDLKKEISE